MGCVGRLWRRGVDKRQDRSRRVPQPLLLISAAVALSLLGDQMLYAVLPIVHEAVGVPVTAIGLLLSANRFVRLFTNGLAGYVIERVGRQAPFVLALLLGGLTTIAYGVIYGVGALLVARVLWGTSWSFIRIEGLSTVFDVATAETRGRYMGMFQAVSRLGSATAMLVGGVLTDMIGFRATFILFGIVSCLAALPAYLVMKRHVPRQINKTLPLQPSPISRTAAGAGGFSQAPVKEVDWGTRWRVAVVSLGTFSTLLVIGGLVSATIGYMLRARFGDTPSLGTLTLGVASLSGLLLSTRGFLELGLAPVAGYLGDRTGRHRLICYVMPVGALMVACLGYLPPLAIVIGIILVMFAAGTTLNVAFTAVAGDIAPADKRTMFLSFFVTCQDLGAAVGPLLGYWIAPAFGLVTLYLSGAGVLALASLLYIATFGGQQRHIC